jgi:hypothetical protein
MERKGNYPTQQEALGLVPSDEGDNGGEKLASIIKYDPITGRLPRVLGVDDFIDTMVPTVWPEETTD